MSERDLFVSLVNDQIMRVTIEHKDAPFTSVDKRNNKHSTGFSVARVWNAVDSNQRGGQRRQFTLKKFNSKLINMINCPSNGWILLLLLWLLLPRLRDFRAGSSFSTIDGMSLFGIVNANMCANP